MSVVEFTLAFACSFPFLIASHEAARLYALHRSAELYIEAHLSETALESLKHIQQSTFASSGDRDTDFERSAKQALRVALADPLLHWGWFHEGDSDFENTLIGIRVNTSGPNQQAPTRNIRLRVHLCVSSWFSPLLAIVSDKRNCLGEFSQKSNSRGIKFELDAERSVPFSVPIYFFGLSPEATR